MPTLSYDKHPFDSSSQIRLLRFKHSATGPPQWTLCRPININVARQAEVAHNFAAVSYEWGGPDDVAPFMIDGKEIELRRNLIDFLRVLPELLRDKQNVPAVFWIDSICIDQANMEEKTNQIRLLRKIYSSATCVLSWLGPLGDGSNLAMKYIRGVHVEAEKSINALLNRRYWTRLWMVQEVVLGRKWYIACGTDIMDGECLSRLLHKPTTPRGILQHSQWLESKANKLVAERARFSLSGPSSLLDLMLRFFELEAEFRVDNVRALLALSKPDTIGNLHNLLERLVDSSGDSDRTKVVIRDICYEMGLLTRVETTWTTRIPSKDLMMFVRSLLDIDIAKKDLCVLANRLRCSRMTIKPDPSMIFPFAAFGAIVIPPLSKREEDDKRQAARDRSMPQSRQGAQTLVLYLPSYLARSSIERGKLERRLGVGTHVFAPKSSDSGKEYEQDCKRRKWVEDEVREGCMKKMKRENEELMKNVSTREWFKLSIQRALAEERHKET
jgi:hypothetical protein